MFPTHGGKAFRVVRPPHFVTRRFARARASSDGEIETAFVALRGNSRFYYEIAAQRFSPDKVAEEDKDTPLQKKLPT